MQYLRFPWIPAILSIQTMALKVVASVVAVASAVDLKWTDCGDSSNHVKITDLQPTSVKVGGTTTLTGTGTLDQDESGGTFDFKAKTGTNTSAQG